MKALTKNRKTTKNKYLFYFYLQALLPLVLGSLQRASPWSPELVLALGHTRPPNVSAPTPGLSGPSTAMAPVRTEHKRRLPWPRKHVRLCLVQNHKVIHCFLLNASVLTWSAWECISGNLNIHFLCYQSITVSKNK